MLELYRERRRRVPIERRLETSSATGFFFLSRRLRAIDDASDHADARRRSRSDRVEAGDVSRDRLTRSREGSRERRSVIRRVDVRDCRRRLFPQLAEPEELRLVLFASTLRRRLFFGFLLSTLLRRSTVGLRRLLPRFRLLLDALLRRRRIDRRRFSRRLLRAGLETETLSYAVVLSLRFFRRGPPETEELGVSEERRRRRLVRLPRRLEEPRRLRDVLASTLSAELVRLLPRLLRLLLFRELETERLERLVV